LSVSMGTLPYSTIL